MTSKFTHSFLLLIFLFFIFCVSPHSYANDRETRSSSSSHSETEKPKRIINKDPRLVFVLQINGDKRDEVKVTPGELESKRIYERHEKAFPILNKTTNQVERVATQVLDITEGNKRFLEKPRRALKVGSVVPGSFLGDNSGQRYILTKDGDRYVDRFKPTDQPIVYTMLHIYDTYSEEVKYFDDAAVFNPR